MIVLRDFGGHQQVYTKAHLLPIAAASIGGSCDSFFNSHGTLSILFEKEKSYQKALTQGRA